MFPTSARTGHTCRSSAGEPRTAGHRANRGCSGSKREYHEPCVRVLQHSQQPLVSCEAVIAESCYLLRALPGAAETVLENVEHGVFQIPLQLSRCAASVRSIMRKYRDVPADFADACLIIWLMN